MTPIISFIIPVYNVEKYISRCLDSIYSLDLLIDKFEVLCIVNCSIDSSVDIIKKYQKKYSNIHLFYHSTNSRQGAARNTGIRYAKGDYCMFIDADDSLPLIDLENLLNYMRKNEIEILIGKANVINEKDKISSWGNPPLEETKIMLGPEIFINETIHKIAFGVVWLAIYSMSLVRRVPPFLEKVRYEDTDWTLRCAYEASSLQYKPITFYNYHNNEGTTTTSPSIISLIERTNQSLRIYEWGLTTTYLHDEVIIAVEDYGTWNLRVLSSLLKYNYSDRRKFYTSFTSHEFKTIASWKGGNYTKLFVRFPILSQCILCFIHPFYKLFKK